MEYTILTFILSSLGDHVTHLENVSEEEINRLLGIVLDVEYLYTCVHKEEDADTKQVYFSLFKVSLHFLQSKYTNTGFHNWHCVQVNIFLLIFQLLRKSILQMGKPTLEAQESPPFEKPGIEQVITCLPAAIHSTQIVSVCPRSHLFIFSFPNRE